MVVVLPIPCRGGWQHSHVLGARPVLGLGLVHLQSLWLLWQLEGLHTLLGPVSGGEHLGLNHLNG